jgi:hypothetical protein
MYWRGLGASAGPAPFYEVAAALLYSWLLGVLDLFSAGAFVHLILAAAVVFLVLGFLQGSRIAA